MKVLIISHNVISTTNNMGKTLLSLFNSFSKEELCQLYIYPSIPDVDVCNSYYRVTDKDVLNSLVKFSLPGNELDKSLIDINKHQTFENLNDSEIYNNNKNGLPLRRILRDIMWKLSRWNNMTLHKWIEQEKPTCIFLAPGYAKFIYDIALEIAEKYDLPIVTYICDDYYFVKKPKSFLGKIQLSLLQKKVNCLMYRTKHLIGICDEISELYLEKFHVPATTIMTGASFEIADRIKVVEKPQTISYFGNIRCNRYISLSEIGQCLDEINNENKTNFKLKIYTDETDINILELLKRLKSIELCNFVTGEEFTKEFFSSELLLHVEAFDEESIEIVKHSVSTKIADCLASGILLIAYGPEVASSIKHLRDNKCGYVIISKETLKEKLLDVFNNKQDIIVNIALSIADICHNLKNNSIVLKNVIEAINE